MNKIMLLTGASVIAFGTVVQAMETDISQYPDLGTHHVQISRNAKHEQLSAKEIVDFTNFSYSVAKTEWAEKDKALNNQLINAGWKLDPFKGTTGSAAHQVESTSGLLAFKGDHVVIAARGTQVTNVDDWKTNVRLHRNPVGRLFGWLTGNTDEAEKANMVAAQKFYGVDGEIVTGFLQTHDSSWAYIKEAILQHAKATGKSTQEFHYTVTGHSQGAAKAQLAALGLLTDVDLGIGINYLEKSFIFSEPEVTDLGASGFYGIGKKSTPQNLGNVQAVVFESPAFATGGVEEILGADNVLRVENRGWVGVDPVVLAAPGFKHVGTATEVNNGTFLTRHMMGNVGPAVLKDGVIEKHRAAVETKKTAAVAPKDSKGDFLAGVKSAFKKVANFFGK